MQPGYQIQSHWSNLKEDNMVGEVNEEERLPFFFPVLLLKSLFH